MKVKNEAGEEIEVPTNDEIEARVNTEKEAARTAALEEAKQSQTELETKLTDAQKKLDDAEKGGNDAQKERLRQERDQAKADAEAAQKKVDEVVKKVDDIQSNLTAETKNELLDAVSNGNKEAREKIEHHYNVTLAAMPSGTKAEIRDRMTQATLLATGTRPAPSALDALGGMGGSRGSAPVYGKGGPESQNSQEMRKAFGIKDDDLKKYEGRSALGNNNQ